MDNTRGDGNHNNNSEMEDEFNNCTDDKVCVYETIITGGFMNEELYDADNKQRRIHNLYIAVKDENTDDQTVVGLTNEKPSNTEYKQGNTYNSVHIKDENVDDLNVVISETELQTNCTDDKLCPTETVISRGYIKQEPHDVKDEPRSIQTYFNIKEEYTDDLTVGVQETELMTDCMDNKVCINETIISGGYIKNEPCEPGNESGNIHNNIDMKGCEECGEEYDLYCLKCPMLIRILDSNNPDRPDNMVRGTLPKNFLDICETQSGMGVLALRAIPKGVVFGPFKGLDLTKDELISKWKLKDKELTVTKDREWLNWMQYIKRTDKSSNQNLVPFQYEGGLYYRSEYHINVGDELLVHWYDSDTEGMEDSNWEALVCENLDDSYACTFCCVGYKSISHLKAHNSTCVEKRNKKDSCEEIVQCDICKIYLDKKEYSDYHMDRCYKSNGKSVFNSCCKRNRDRPLHNGDRPFWCTLCPYKAKTKSRLREHIAIHNEDKPFACTLCPYKTTANCVLKRHMTVHNHDRPFACNLCPYKALTESILKKHMDNHNAERQFACTICPYKTKTRSNLNQHIANHNGDKPFECTLCPYKTKTKSLLKKHITIHNDDKPFACILCPYKMNYKSCLEKHIGIHNAERPFACTICPYKTKTRANLNQHIAIHNDDRPFACIVCPYKAKTKSNLKKHIIIHNDDKQFACTHCSYKTNYKSCLKKHIGIHNAERPFACTICPYKTTTKSILKQHMGIHHGDRPFACTICLHRAKKRSSLNRHIAIHSDDKPFACLVCPYKAKIKALLKRHIAIHNSGKPFACLVCPYKAKIKSHLKRHIAIHYSGIP